MPIKGHIAQHMHHAIAAMQTLCCDLTGTHIKDVLQINYNDLLIVVQCLWCGDSKPLQAPHTFSTFHFIVELACAKRNKYLQGKANNGSFAHST